MVLASSAADNGISHEKHQVCAVTASSVVDISSGNFSFKK